MHDNLYDLQDFIDKHPGGKDWIKFTQGTDITEAYEASHVAFDPSKILEKYYVKPATKPRNSPYTFEDDGFYKTLKRKIKPILKACCKTGKKLWIVIHYFSPFLRKLVLTLLRKF